MKKKIFMFICIILSIIFIVFYKTSKRNSDTGVLKGNLTIIAEGENYNYLLNLCEKFKKNNPKVNITIKEMEEDYFKKGFEDSLKKPNNNADIVIMPSRYVNYFGSKYPLSFSEVNEFISSYRDSIRKERIDQVTIGDKIMAFPFYDEPVVLYYNKLLLDSNNLKIEDISTWNHILSLKNSMNNNILAYTGEDYFEFYNILINQLKVDKSKKDNHVNEIKAMEVLKEIFKDNRASILNEDEATKLLINGDIPFIIGNNKTLNEIYINVPSNKKVELGVSKIPSFEPGGNRDVLSSGYNFAIMKESKNKKLAETFIEFTLLEKYSILEATNSYNIFLNYNKYQDESIYNTSYSFINERKPLRILDNINRNGTYLKININDLENKDKINEDITKIINSENSVEKDMEDLMGRYNK
ncbi:ABC transporter substrate-binding protein [Clostridium algidicarnis]|uniref:Carbohydrate ABC transporter substrate-binding protein (CUT1 family) n=2 Tax=Clostridium algidicarnis TaxID=37659 RepID=A0A2S6FZM4_9CLOT|nr:extracellular solute-binding protein [Clostridium algidicarnis]MBB6631032.1 extracellular solute-binding protein [Clostridium algidicarnis]MBB6698209.1 extracellular solute-binding protein [Clostridium algidicarnis]MBU3220182.1 extracellular solute-binding protein [Clostridium algidicarnis]PPK48913.1 carbohydrate ABC transporter substrate-binding protein (CUT1 family) [Clostridium algidicarnis DSM 15099]